MAKKRTEVPTVPAPFAPVVAAFADDAEVTAGTMFRADNVVLKVRGKIFAMWAQSAVVVKLPRARVVELLDGGAAPFDPGHGRVMKEWVTVPETSRWKGRWVALAREAHAYVGALATTSRRAR